MARLRPGQVTLAVWTLAPFLRRCSGVARVKHLSSNWSQVAGIPRLQRFTPKGHRLGVNLAPVHPERTSIRGELWTVLAVEIRKVKTRRD